MKCCRLLQKPLSAAGDLISPHVQRRSYLGLAASKEVDRKLVVVVVWLGVKEGANPSRAKTPLLHSEFVTCSTDIVYSLLALVASGLHAGGGWSGMMKTTGRGQSTTRQSTAAVL